MAGIDYSGFAVNFQSNEVTYTGAIGWKDRAIWFHKSPDPELKVLVPATDTSFGIARLNDWFCVFGYGSNPEEFLKKFLKKYYPKYYAIFDRTLKKAKRV